MDAKDGPVAWLPFLPLEEEDEEDETAQGVRWSGYTPGSSSEAFAVGKASIWVERPPLPTLTTLWEISMSKAVRSLLC